MILFITFQSRVFVQNSIKTRCTYTYNVEIFDSMTNQSFSEIIKLKRKIGFTNGFQKKIIWEYTPNEKADSITIYEIYKLMESSNCTTTTCNSNWEVQNQSYLFEKTGLIENKSKLWIHPPRSKYFRILEFAPFPYLNKLDSIYTDTIILGNGWGDLKGEKIISNYITKEKDSYTIVKAESNSILGNTESIFTINKMGFIKMEYLLFSRYKITFILLND